MIFCSPFDKPQVLVLKNSGSGFEHYQEINLTDYPSLLGIADDMSMLLVTVKISGYKLLICLLGSDGKY